MDQLDQESKQLANSISQYAYALTRHDHIRLKLWLDKLTKPITNSIWKQNRNLYLKAMLQMVQEGALQKPFHLTPPQGPLPKITLYDLPYPIRLKLMHEDARPEHKSSSSHKTSSFSRKNSATSKNHEKRSLSKNGKSMEHKKKISFDGKTEEIENISYLQSFKNQTMKTEDFHWSSMDTHKTKSNTQKIHFKQKTTHNPVHHRALTLLKKTLDFLTANCEDLEGQIQYRQIVEKIVGCGEEAGEKWEGEEGFEKRNQRIKENFLKGDLNSLQFLSYLDSLH